MADAVIKLDADVASYIRKLENVVKKTEKAGRKTKEVQTGWQKTSGTIQQALPGLTQFATTAGAIAGAVGLIRSAWRSVVDQIGKANQLARENAILARQAAGGGGFGPEFEQRLSQARQQILAQGSGLLLEGLGAAGEAYSSANFNWTQESRIAAERFAGQAELIQSGSGRAAATALGQLELVGVSGDRARDLAIAAVTTGSADQALRIAINRYEVDGRPQGLSFEEYLAQLTPGPDFSERQAQALRALQSTLAPGGLTFQDRFGQAQRSRAFEEQILPGQLQARRLALGESTGGRVLRAVGREIQRESADNLTGGFGVVTDLVTEGSRRLVDPFDLTGKIFRTFTGGDGPTSEKLLGAAVDELRAINGNTSRSPTTATRD